MAVPTALCHCSLESQRWEWGTGTTSSFSSPTGGVCSSETSQLVCPATDSSRKAPPWHQSLRLDRRREWWWRAERSGTPPPPAPAAGPPPPPPPCGALHLPLAWGPAACGVLEVEAPLLVADLRAMVLAQLAQHRSAPDSAPLSQRLISAPPLFFLAGFIQTQECNSMHASMHIISTHACYVAQP